MCRVPQWKQKRESLGGSCSDQKEETYGDIAEEMECSLIVSQRDDSGGEKEREKKKVIIPLDNSFPSPTKVITKGTQNVDLCL